MTTRQDTRPALVIPSRLTWRRSGSVYYAVCRELGMTAEVGRIGGTRRWYIRVWPHALAPCPDRLIRMEAGVRTMAGAQAMALRTPCFRCGRGIPLIRMERHSPRWRCLAREECEAERDRITGNQGWDPLDVGAYMARSGTDASRAVAVQWAIAYRRASRRLFGLSNTRGLTALDAAAAAAQADEALTAMLANVVPLTGKKDGR